ncbi:MAG: hypothetical protein VW830_10905, partial [Rhodobiaceae bacterium]
VDYIIPGNDDALRAMSFYCELAQAAVLDGLQTELMKSGGDVGAATEAPAEAAVSEVSPAGEAPAEEALAAEAPAEAPAQEVAAAAEPAAVEEAPAEDAAPEAKTDGEEAAS